MLNSSKVEEFIVCAEIVTSLKPTLLQ